MKGKALLGVCFLLVVLLSRGGDVAWAQGEGVPLSFGEEVEVTVAEGQRRHVYLFTADQGDRVSFFLESDDLVLSDARLSILGPDGTVFVEGWADEGDSFKDVLLPAGGEYRLQFSFEEGLSGTYVMRAYRDSLSDPIPLEFGTPHSGKLGPQERDRYLVQGQAGWFVAFFISDDKDGSSVRCHLLDEEGNVLEASSSAGPFRYDAIADLSLPADGTYLLEVWFDGEQGGSYVLEPYRRHVSEEGPLAFEEPIDGEFEPLETDRYEFQGRAGEEISFYLEVSFYPADVQLRLNDVQLVLLDAAGNEVARSDLMRPGRLEEVALPRDGMYVLEIGFSERIVLGQQEVGSYVLEAYRFDPERETIPLRFNERVEGTVEVGGRDIYVFQGEVGTLVNAYLSSEERPVLDFTLSLIGPDGEETEGELGTSVESGQLFIVLEDVLLESAGEYRLVVDIDREGPESEAYTLAAHAVEQPEPMKVGHEVAGSIEVPGGYDRFLFEGEAEEDVAVSISWSVDRYVRLVATLFGPDGERVLEKTAQRDFAFRAVLPATGTYELRVNPQGLVTLDYTLSLTRPTPSQYRPEEPIIEVVFVFDTSSSMADEIDALCTDVEQAIEELAERGATAGYTIMGIAASDELACSPRSVETAFAEPQAEHIEDWGWAVADIAQGYDWTSGPVRLIIPLSDEGPDHGDPVQDPGGDRDSIEAAIAAAKGNSVVVSPVLGTGYNPDVRALAQELADETGGDLFITVDPEYDLVEGILRLIGLSVERHTDVELEEPGGFVERVPLPDEVEFTPPVVGTNLALSVLLALGFGFFSMLFNKTLEENEDDLLDRLRWLRKRRRRATSWTQPPWWRRALTTVLLLGVTTLIYAFLDLNFGFDPEGALFLISLFVALVVTMFAYEGLQAFAGRVLYDLDGGLRPFPLAALIAVGCVLLTRLTRFQPGYLLGFVVTFVLVSGEDALEDTSPLGGLLLVLLPGVVTLAVSTIAWLFAQPLLEIELLHAILVTVFVNGLETLLFVLIPLQFLDGAVLFRTSRIVWGLTFGVVAYVFSQILLNPRGEYLAAFAQTNVQIAFVLLAVYGLVAWGFWFACRRWLRGRSSG